MMTKAKSRIRFRCCNHANEFGGMFVYLGVINTCFHSMIVAVMKYRCDGSCKAGKVISSNFLSSSSAKDFLCEAPPGMAAGAMDILNDFQIRETRGEPFDAYAFKDDIHDFIVILDEIGRAHV